MNDETTIVILNGALDKLRMGYYSVSGGVGQWVMGYYSVGSGVG